jgi:hypothetical protein
VPHAGASLPTDLKMFVLMVLLQSGPCSLQDIYDKLLSEQNASHTDIDDALVSLLNDGKIKADESSTPVKFETVFDEPTKAALLLVMPNVLSSGQLDAATTNKVIEYPFPVSPEIAAKVAEQSRFLGDLVVLTSPEIISRLRVRYRFTNHPHLARLANAILKQSLSCLSYDGNQYWLTFNKSGHPVHLRGVNSIPLPLYDKFQIQSVPGLEEFLQNFGGMSNGWNLPASNYFLLPSESVCVSSDDIHRDWGTIGDWAGSLLFYKGATGDQVVIHPDGTPAAWFHDAAWESLDEIPFRPVGMSFPNLIDHLAACIELPTDSPNWSESPFYY